MVALFRKKLGMEETPKQQNNELLPKWRKIMEEYEQSERHLEYTSTTFSSCFLMVLGGITSQGLSHFKKSSILMQ